MFWQWFPQKRCGASLSERPYYRLSRSSRIVAREVGSLRHHVISLNLVKDSLLLIKDLEESRHDEHEGDAGACPSHLKYKLLDDVVHEKALIDEFVEEVVSLVLDQFLTFRNTSLLCLLFASHFDSIQRNEISQLTLWYLLGRGILLEVCALLLRLLDGCLHLRVVHYVYVRPSVRAICQIMAKWNTTINYK